MESEIIQEITPHTAPFRGDRPNTKGSNRIVLADGSKYTVPKSILCDSSSYFVTALAGPVLGNSTRTLNLSSCDTTTLEVFLFWTVTGELPDSLQYRDGVAEGFDLSRGQDAYEAQIMQGQLSLVRLWVFADAYLMPVLQNEVMRSFAASNDGNLSQFQVVKLATDIVPHGCVLWEAVLTELTYTLDTKPTSFFTSEEKDVLRAVPGFWEEVTKRLHKVKSGSFPILPEDMPERYLVPE